MSVEGKYGWEVTGEGNKVMQGNKKTKQSKNKISIGLSL
jgi:hypothetical protein